MKTLSLCLILALSVLAQNTFEQVPIRNGLKQYVAFGKELYQFDLPSMKLGTHKTYNKIISYAPTSVTSTALYFSNNNGGNFEINTNDFTLKENAGRAVPNGQSASGGLTYLDSKLCASDGKGTSYCFYGGNPAKVSKTIDGQPGQTNVTLGKNVGFSRFVKLDTAAGLLYVTGFNAIGRGSDDYTYWQLSLSPFAVKNGPIVLDHTALSGCPVPPRQCAVDVLSYMDASNGVLSYVYSLDVPSTTGGPSAYQINVVSHSFSCGFASAQFDDLNHKNPTTTGSCGGSTPTSSSGTTAPTSTCPSNCGANPCCNDVRLGQTCYNPSTHHCATDPNGSKVLCGVSDQSCGNYCYDPTMYGCRNGALYHL